MDECIDFINSIEGEKAFMICSGALGQTTVPIVHNKPQVIIQVWLLLTTISEGYITTWASTRKHFHIMKNTLKSVKKFFLHSILTWVLLTTASVGFIETRVIIRKHFHTMNALWI
jgi:hypothetical protein